MRLGDLMARVRAASVSQHLTPDLAQELLRELGQRARLSERHELRNELLRRAASQLEGLPWTRAKLLEAEIKRVVPRCTVAAVPGSVRDLVIQAVEIDPATPRSWRQILRIINR